MGIYLVLLIPVLLLSMFVQWRFRSKFSKYAEVQLNSGFSGKEVAEKMLNDYGIFDVKVMSTEGQLSDHYNPDQKTINLMFIMVEALQQQQLQLTNVVMLYNKLSHTVG
jgi:Zn-dependent membrane protease YugP